MLSGEKILITGPAGRIAWSMTKALAPNNEVWGIARFSDPAQQAEVEALGVTTRKVDLATCDFGDLPRDFTYLLHIAVSFDDGPYDRAIQVNAESCGFLLDHCRSAKAALVMSTITVYKPHPDPWRPFREDDPLGDMMAHIPPSYPIAKTCEEAIARYCARAFNLPVVIGRMNAAYGARGGLPIQHLNALVAGELIQPRWDPQPYSPIHVDDIADQVEAMLSAASVPATILNWGGDQPVSIQQWTAYMAGLLDVTPKMLVKPIPGSSLGAVADNSKRMALTGPCKVTWEEGLRRVVTELYPDRIRR